MPPMSSGTLDRIRILRIHALRSIKCVARIRIRFRILSIHVLRIIACVARIRIRIRILSIHARRMIECVVTARRSFGTALGLRGFQVLGADKSVAAIVVDIFCHQNHYFCESL